MIRDTSDPFHLELLSLSKADDKYQFLYVYSCSILEGCHMPLALTQSRGRFRWYIQVYSRSARDARNFCLLELLGIF